MPTSRTSETLTDSSFVCECGEWLRSACRAEPFYKERNGKRYCVLHFPDKRKSQDFTRAFQRKIKDKDFNFRGVWFPDNPEFLEFEFDGHADFIRATFAGQAEFYRATFHLDAYFTETRFLDGANFGQVKFNASANFEWATFHKEVEFSYAEFSGDVDFANAGFNNPVAFFGATFKDRVRFAEDGKKQPTFSVSLDLQFARVEKPEHFSLHTLVARPSSFINVDARKFQFTNVDWIFRSTDDEIRSLQNHGVSSPHRMLSIACRHLAVNAEENHRYEEASRFRYVAMDARRLERWHGFDFRRLGWWYWLASGYGERVLRAFGILLAILLVSAALYTQVGFLRWEPKLASESDSVNAQRDETGAPLRLSRALTYSAAVMTLQKPDPRPATITAQIVVLLETILGPVQAALLALAIRRKFMR